MKKRFWKKIDPEIFDKKIKNRKRPENLDFLDNYFPVLSSKQKPTSTSKRKTIWLGPSLSKHGYILTTTIIIFSFT